MLLLDTGLFLRILGLDIREILFQEDFDLINKGALAEQYCGLELLKAASPYRQDALYYWHREATNSNAEVDYVVQRGDQIVPIEVKSGRKGTMQSLRIFLNEKECPYGIRFSLEPYGTVENIQIWPLYAVSKIYNNSARAQ